jgi:hypothetical protein
VDNADLLKEIKMKSKVRRGKKTAELVGKGLLNQWTKRVA